MVVLRFSQSTGEPPSIVLFELRRISLVTVILIKQTSDSSGSEKRTLTFGGPDFSAYTLNDGELYFLERR